VIEKPPTAKSDSAPVGDGAGAAPHSTPPLLGRRGGKLRRIPYFRLPTDPRIVINVHDAGTEVVEVHLPTLWGTLS
jgi:hypothetical protein